MLDEWKCYFGNDDERKRSEKELEWGKLTCNLIFSCLRELFSFLALRSSLSLNFSKDSLGRVWSSSLTGIGAATGAILTSLSLPAESFASRMVFFFVNES